MATTTNTPVANRQEPDANDIRRHMAQIRRELHEDFQGVVRSAEAATDWRRFFRMYPYPFVGAAALIGFVIVPPRRRSMTNLARRAADAAIDQAQELAATAAAAAKSPAAEETTKRTLVGAAFAMIAPMAWKFARGYATQYASQYVENWVAQQMAQTMNAGPARHPSEGPSARRSPTMPGPGSPPPRPERPSANYPPSS